MSTAPDRAPGGRAAPGAAVSVVAVHGGAAGLEVEHAALERAADLLAGAGAALLGLAADRARLLADADLLASAALHPVGAARVEAALARAVTGPQGVAAAAARLELRAGQLAVAVARYRAVDRLEQEAVDARRWLLGAGAPLTLPLLPAAALAGGAWWAATSARGDDPGVAAQRWLTDRPGLVDDLAGATSGLTAPLRAGLAGPLPLVADAVFRAGTGRSLLPETLEESAGLLALLYVDTPPRVTAVREDTSRRAVLVPGGVGDVLSRLDRRVGQATGARQGDLGVTRVVTTAADGSTAVSWIVDVPGTSDWQPLPGSPRPHLNDLATNLELMAGEPSARVDAVAQVLAASGAQRGQPVLLVGHSQGGMVAVRAAQELADRFSITHVVTAGSPVGGMAAPPGTSVLSLENAADLVPRLDARDNPATAGHTTVVVHVQTDTAVGNHATGTAYLSAARTVDRLAAQVEGTSVRAWLESADAFLAGRGERHAVTTTVWTVDGGSGVRR